MFRQNLFIGLTIMLGAVLAWLIIQSRRQENEIVAPKTEVVRALPPSKTRVIKPEELEITDSRMEIARPVAGAVAEDPPGYSAKHGLAIHNHGSVTYQDPLIKITYVGKSGEVLEFRSRVVSGQIAPGQSLAVQDLVIDGIPGGSATCRLRILHADVDVSPPAGSPR